MRLMIDKNGKAVDVEDVSVTIICESREEADRLREGMANGRVRLMEWHPIGARNGGKMPRDGEIVLVAVRTGRGILQTVWTTIDIYGRDGDEMRFASFEPGELIAWAPLPEPYKEEEET